jgi:hypothetical protein
MAHAEELHDPLVAELYAEFFLQSEHEIHVAQ